MKAFSGLCGVDSARDASLNEMIDEVSDAITRYLQNGNLLRTTYTVILNAPTYPALVLPFAPVKFDPDTFDLFIWFNSNAQGDPTQFTDDFLLTPYTDWTLETGLTDSTTSENGIVRFQNGIYGFGRERPVYSLTTKVVPLYGCLKVQYVAGYDPIPAALRGAVNIVVMKLYNARRTGVAMTSESLGGYSYSAQGSATADGIITGDPTVRKMLSTFSRPQVGNYH